jgi:hypothetical protein
MTIMLHVMTERLHDKLFMAYECDSFIFFITMISMSLCIFIYFYLLTFIHLLNKITN